MSDGDSNDKENSTLPTSPHLVPDANDKLSMDTVTKDDETSTTTATAGDGDASLPTSNDSSTPSGDSAVNPSSSSSSSTAPDAAAAAAVLAAAAVVAAPVGDPIDIKVVWNKNKYDVVVRPEETVLDLKTKMQELTQLPPSMQKIMFKGLCKDDRTMKVKGKEGPWEMQDDENRYLWVQLMRL